MSTTIAFQANQWDNHKKPKVIIMELNFLLTYLLVLVALFFSSRMGLGLERRILIGSARAFLQLMLMGFVLVWLFGQDNLLISGSAILFMIFFAAYTANRHSELEKGFFVALPVIFLGVVIVLGSLLLFDIINSHTKELLPIAGMIIGNALNVYTLTVNRLKSDVVQTINVLEAKVALGEELKSAMKGSMQSAVKAAMLPILNNLNTVGLVLIPGVTVGMLLAGADPMKAVAFQLVIMYMIVGVAVFTGIFTVNFGYLRVMETQFRAKGGGN